LNDLSDNPDVWLRERQQELQAILNGLSKAKGPDRNPQGDYPEFKTVWQDRRDELMQTRNARDEWLREKRAELQSKVDYVETELEDI